MRSTLLVLCTLVAVTSVWFFAPRQSAPSPVRDVTSPVLPAEDLRTKPTMTPSTRTVVTKPATDTAIRSSPWERPATRLRADLRGPGGVPLANRYVDFHLRFAEGEEEFPLNTTDATGRFEWSVSRRSAHEVPVRSVTYTIAPWTRDALTITVPLARTLKPGVDDLGELILAPPPLVASGRVVDPRGVPHANAEVHVFAQEPPGSQDGEGTSADERRWTRPWPPVKSVTDDRGTFELRGEWQHATLALLATPPEGLEGRLTPARHGAVGIELVVERAAAVAGSCLLDDPTSRETVTIEAFDGSGSARTSRASVHPAGDGSFRIPRLRPGPGEVVVTCGNRELVRVTDLVLVSGVTTEDPRLRGVDARRGYRATTVTVVDARGVPIWGARVAVVVDGQALVEVGTDRQGKARLIAPSLPALVWVYDEAYRPSVRYAGRLVQAEGTELRVELQDGPRVRLRLETKLPIPGDLRLCERLRVLREQRPEGAPPGPAVSGPGAITLGFAPSKAGEPFHVSAPGTYAATCEISDADGHTVEVHCVPRVLTVLGSPRVEEFTLAVGEGDLRAAIASLRK